MRMKNILILGLTLFIGLQSFAQRKPKIKGNKNVVEVKEELPPFYAIDLADDLEVVLEKANKEGYALEIDDNLIDVLKFKVEDNTLKISSFYNITSKKKLNITVYYTELAALSMSNGEISMKDVISGEQLDVHTSGPSRLELNATADVININMDGISSGDFNVASDSLVMTLKDRIDVKVYTTVANSSVYMYKNASAKMEGATDFLMAKLYGNTNLKAEMLEAKSTMLIMEDSPQAKVNVLEDFQLSSRGSAKTSLYGNPKINIIDFLDTSQLDKEKN
ncbi:DUF2807 domain-containing protein [Maribacter sp. MMG018]|nr:DUF2807 domain-containing protein [Maribacter sp. MMG018]